MDGNADRIEILREMMRGPNGATVEDILKVTGWPVELVEDVIGQSDFENSDFNRRKHVA